MKIPNIRKLLRAGTSATVVGVAPSTSVPSLTSIVTGVPPFEHGLEAEDHTIAPAAIKVPTLWQAAAANHLKVAAINWPATLGAQLALNFPDYRPTGSSKTVEFAPIAEKANPTGVADQVEKMFPGFEKQVWDDSSSAQAAIWALATEKPDLLLVRFGELGSEQRDTGALSVYARDILANEDDLIGQILAKAPPSTVTAIVSGHGFENRNYVVRPHSMLRNPAVQVENGLIGALDETSAASLRTLLKDGRNHGLSREVPISEVRAYCPALARWVAAFDTKPNYFARDETRGPALGPGDHLAGDGLWPTRPNYRSLFVVAGPGIEAKKAGEIDLLQIAPTLAEVIGVKLDRAKRSSLLTANKLANR